MKGSESMKDSFARGKIEELRNRIGKLDGSYIGLRLLDCPTCGHETIALKKLDFTLTTGVSLRWGQDYPHKDHDYLLCTVCGGKWIEAQERIIKPYQQLESTDAKRGKANDSRKD
jgi:hypothetical protein